MERSKYLMGLSEERSGVMTKSVNVFDQTSRQIRCIKKTHDYLGDGTLITEEELESYDESILLHEQEKWLSSMLEAGMEDIRAGRGVPAKETIEEIRRKYQI